MITTSVPVNKKNTTMNKNLSHPQAQHFTFTNDRGFIMELELCRGMSPSITITRPDGESEVIFFDWFDESRAITFAETIRQLGMMERTA